MDTIKARKRVKRHLRRRGEDCDFEITPQFVMFWWRVLNNAVFGGILDAPKRIEIRNFRDCYGWCKGYKRNNDVVIGMCRDFEDRKQFLTILVHEMVHSYEHQHTGKMSHGKGFTEWEGRIKRNTGLTLTEFID